MSSFDWLQIFIFGEERSKERSKHKAYMGPTSMNCPERAQMSLSLSHV